MKALVYTGPEKVEIQDVPSPSPQPGDVLLRISVSGVCGSDIHGFLGHSERRKPGLILGHEAVARVAEAHPSVKGWKPGQRVVINPLISCGACAPCGAGRQNLCPTWQVLGLDRRHGTYAEYVAVPASQLYPISEELPEKHAIMTEPLANIVHFYRISLGEVPETAAIVGAGTIGILALLMAKLRGITRVCVIDRNEKRLEVARKLGADLVLNSDRADAVQEGRRFFGGEGAEYVVEAAGHEPTRRAAVNLCRRGGRVLFIGMAEMNSSLPWIEMIRDEKAIFTTFAYTPRDFATSLRLIESGKIDLTPWTEVRPLEEGQEGLLKITHNPGETLKLMFTV
jgi:2-desacetyl-2-hydroxyethyl bacteriochlorophyllide A dehydrogenase